MQDEPLPKAARLGLTLHLATCTLCRRFNSQTRFLRSVFSQFHAHIDEAAPPHLSQEAADRIVARLRKET